jgi:antitoxin (DNA-binding transcriptional repressor) of toxin-antitoxin stability system
MTKTMSIEEAEASLSEVGDHATLQGERVILLRDGDPVAAVIGLPELERLNTQDAPSPGSLAEIAGQWEGFEEIAPFVDEAFQSRGKSRA